MALQPCEFGEEVKIKRYTAKSATQTINAGATGSFTFNFTDGTAKDADNNSVIIPADEGIIFVALTGTGSTVSLPRYCYQTAKRTVSASILNTGSTAASVYVSIYVFTISGPDVDYTF